MAESRVRLIPPLLNQGEISWSTAGGPCSLTLVNKGRKQGGSAPGIEKELKAFSSFQYRAPGCGLLEDWASSRIQSPLPTPPARRRKRRQRLRLLFSSSVGPPPWHGAWTSVRSPILPKPESILRFLKPRTQDPKCGYKQQTLHRLKED
jgi:hypothetical protein